MLLCPGGCALRAPRSARSRYKVDVAVRRRWASPSFIQFVFSDRFKVSQIPSFCVYELNFAHRPSRHILMHILLDADSTKRRDRCQQQAPGTVFRPARKLVRF